MILDETAIRLRNRIKRKRRISEETPKMPEPEDLSPPPAADSGNNGAWSPVYGGGAKLDSDTINYIHRIYCRECRMEEQRRKEQQKEEQGQPTSPQTQVDSHSIQQTMDKNKESLKRKLMLRRSVNELVDQGIYPPLKTPPAYAEQRKQLERAKTGDLLKHKIQHRPNREALVQQHILEDSRAHPTLQERQRLLKRARLQDSLTEKIANRPGPLELVEGNILQTDSTLIDALKDGSLHYNRTCEGEDPHRTAGGTRHFVFDDDSNTSDGAPSPNTAEDHDSTAQSVGVFGMPRVASIPSPPDITPLLQKIQQQAVTKTPQAACLSGDSIPPITTQSFTNSQPSSSNSFVSSSNKNSSSSSNGNSNKATRMKKQKPKSTPKTKVIKFHEYKGPPNVVKTQQSVAQSNNSETPYHILLQQQQLFLQWQLEFQQKNMPFILPAQQKAAAEAAVAAGQIPAIPPGGISGSSPVPSVSATSTAPSPAPTCPTPTPTPTPPQQNTSNQGQSKVISNFEEMKVADLRAELKKRNLTVSGSKPQLIERLKPYADSILTGPSSSASETSNLSSVMSPPSSVMSPPVMSPPSSVMSPPVMSPPSSVTSPSSSLVMSPASVQSVCSGGVLNIQPVTPPSVQSVGSPVQVEEQNVYMGSPPMSPCGNSQDFNNSTPTPMSPDNPNMEVMSPPTFTIGTQQLIKTQLNTSQSSIPMAIDQNLSRPPSTAPVQDMMDIDLNSSQTSLPSVVDQNQNPQTTQLIGLPIVPTSALQAALAAQPPVLTQYTHQDLVRQQQKQIAELQRQLQQSRMKLHEAQKAAGPQVQQQQPVPQLHQVQQLQQVQFPTLQQSIQQPPQISVSLAQAQTIKTEPQVTGLQAVQQSTVQQPVVAQIQIQQVQPAVPSVTVTTATTTKTKDSKPNLTNFFQHQALHQSLNLGQPKVFSFATAPPGGQPFIFTSKPEPLSPEKTNKPQVTTIEVNGMNSANTRASSVPTSPIEHNKLQRSTTNPFFKNIPLKEPPKYDEAIKNKQNVLGQAGEMSSSGSSTTATSTASTSSSTIASSTLTVPGLPCIKSQAMDDVLEILIRHGELPPSAAQEPPPTPKTTTEQTSQTGASVPTQTVATLPMGSMGNMVSAIVIPVSSAAHFSAPEAYSGAVATTVTNSIVTPITAVATQGGSTTPQVSQMSPGGSRKDPPPPLTLTSAISTTMSNSVDQSSLLNDALANNIELPFVTMDWSDSDTANMLDLPDALDSHSLLRSDGSDLLSVPSSSQQGTSTLNGSEPNLNTLDLNDADMPDSNCAMNIDVSDWLDVIMPSTGLTPLSANAPVSFPSDPILTPKPQDVLEMFNMEESDLFTPTDICSGVNFEKVVESSKS